MPTQLDDIAEILISSEAIAAKVHELGQLVTATYQGSDLLLVSVLKGAIVFLTDLMRAILDLPLAIDFLAISGYGGQGTAGVVRLLADLDHIPADAMCSWWRTPGYRADPRLSLADVAGPSTRQSPGVTPLDRPVRRIVDLLMAFSGP